MKNMKNSKLYKTLYADTAMKQIEEKNYPEALKEYKDNLLIVGINYDKKTRKHECRIQAVPGPVKFI